MKQALLNKITNCSFDKSDRTLRKVLTELRVLHNDIEELKSVFNIDATEGSGEQLLQVIIFSRLPGSLKNELMQITGVVYPTLKDIFERSLEAVEKINARKDTPSPSIPKKKDEIVSIDSISATANAKSGPKKIRKESTSEDGVSQKNSRICILCSDSHL